MSVIVRMPGAPLLNQQGKPYRPMATLLGGRHAETWQTRAAQEVAKAAATVIRTDTPKGSLQAMELYLDESDVVLLWCPKQALYLDEWMWAAWMLASHQTRSIPHVCGIDPAADHPMVGALEYMLQARGVSVLDSLDDAIARTCEACRQRRRDHG